MPVGLRDTGRLLLATESQHLRPIPKAYTCSSEIDLPVNLHEVDAQVLDGDDWVGWWGAGLVDELGEAASDEVLDRLISTGPTAAERDAVG